MNLFQAADSPIASAPEVSDSPLYTAFPYFPDPESLVRQFRELLDSKWLTNRGLLVQRFETEIAEYLGDPKARVITCCNATVGLEIVLRALALRGKVIVTPMSFVSTLHSIVNAGLEPVFADIDPKTFCLSPADVERVLTPDVCAVVPVHLYGNVCDVDYFEKLREKGIRILYDAAHAFGVKFRGQSVGLFGDAEVFSFHATKILNACEGGAIVTRDEKLANRIRLMTNFGILNETEVECIGTNGKLSEVHALFGLNSLSHVEKAIARRLALSKVYLQALREVPHLRFPTPTKGTVPNGQFFPVLLPNPATRDALYDHLTALEIYARKYFYPPIHRLKPYERLGTRPLPVADLISGTILCLPLHSSLTASQVEHVADHVREFLTKD